MPGVLSDERFWFILGFALEEFQPPVIITRQGAKIRHPLETVKKSASKRLFSPNPPASDFFPNPPASDFFLQIPSTLILIDTTWFNLLFECLQAWRSRRFEFFRNQKQTEGATSTFFLVSDFVSNSRQLRFYVWIHSKTTLNQRVSIKNLSLCDFGEKIWLLADVFAIPCWDSVCLPIVCGYVHIYIYVRGMDPNCTHPLFASNYTHSHVIGWLIEWLMCIACHFFPFFSKNHHTCGV